MIVISHPDTIQKSNLIMTLQETLFKLFVACLLVISICSNVFAECEQLPESDYAQHRLTSYINSHDIFEPIERNTSVEDVLEVWDKKSNDLCFFVTFVTNDYHMCFLGGKALKVSANEYSYSENKCRVSIKFMSTKVKFTAKGSLTDGCSTDDLSEQNGCGFNTSIESAVFKKNGKPSKKQ